MSNANVIISVLEAEKSHILHLYNLLVSDLSVATNDIQSLDLALSTTQTDLSLANVTISGLEGDLSLATDSILILDLALSSSQANLSSATGIILNLEDSLISEVILSFNEGFILGEASVIPEDGVTQTDLEAQADISYGFGYGDGIASVECEEILMEYLPLDLPMGWSIFGYTCLDSIDVTEGLIEISDKIDLLKDEYGNSYLPEWSFNAIGDFKFSKGYQIKMLEQVDGFQFCPTFVGSLEP